MAAQAIDDTAQAERQQAGAAQPSTSIRVESAILFRRKRRTRVGVAFICAVAAIALLGEYYAAVNEHAWLVFNALLLFALASLWLVEARSRQPTKHAAEVRAEGVFVDGAVAIPAESIGLIWTTGGRPGKGTTVRLTMQPGDCVELKAATAYEAAQMISKLGNADRKPQTAMAQRVGFWLEVALVGSASFLMTWNVAVGLLGFVAVAAALHLTTHGRAEIERDQVRITWAWQRKTETVTYSDIESVKETIYGVVLALRGGRSLTLSQLCRVNEFAADFMRSKMALSDDGVRPANPAGS